MNNTQSSKQKVKPLSKNELNEIIANWEQEDKKLRNIYLNSPNRKQFFEYNFAEALWMQVIEYYGKVVGDEAIEWMSFEILEDNRLWEMVYDVCEKYAKKQGWEEVN